MTAAPPDELAFHRRICDEPQEDAPRLVYADWLEGDAEPLQPERAEFIRIQCELARIPDPPDAEMIGLRASVREQKLRALLEWKKRWTATYYALRRRERELFAVIGDKWFQDAVTLLGGPEKVGLSCVEVDPDELANWPAYLTVRRGFIWRVECTAAAFLGGECDVCRGRGHFGADPGRVAKPCQKCSGTGRTPGAAAGLRLMPVESVRLSDKRPTPMLGHEADRGRGAWYDQGLLDAASPGEGPHPYGVPAELFGLLTGHVDGARGGMAWYDAEADALDALSAAAVAYLRGLRGGA